jgi:hypothetical protein
MLLVPAEVALLAGTPATTETLLGLSGMPGCAALLTRLLLGVAGSMAGSCALPKFLQAEARSSTGARVPLGTYALLVLMPLLGLAALPGCRAAPSSAFHMSAGYRTFHKAGHAPLAVSQPACAASALYTALLFDLQSQVQLSQQVLQGRLHM